MRPRLDLDDLSRVTYTAVFSDVLDAMGLRAQTLPPKLTHQGRDAGDNETLVGWARTVQSVPVSEAPDRSYGAEIDFIDSLGPGDVVVGECGGSTSAAWGELFSAAARARGARGAVINGYVRDRSRLPGDFPIYARGARPTDSLGRLSVVRSDHAMALCGFAVHQGDLVVADLDGVVIVPAGHAEEAAARALEKASVESAAKAMLREGALLRDAWERHRVL